MFQPVIKWTGSKRSQAAEIIKCFPNKIKCYHEPFLGGGAMMRAVMESGIEVEEYRLSDINADLINLWIDIRNAPDRLADGYAELWHALNDADDDKQRKTAFYNDVRRRFNATRDTVDFLFLLRTCANGMPRYNSRGEFNTSFHITRNGIMPDTMRAILKEWNTLLVQHNITLTACSYEQIQTVPGDFMYLDPPYAGTKGIYYGCIDYERFFRWMSSQKGGYALSFDGRCNERDYTYAVPQDIYDNHLYIRSGNSSFRRVTGKSKDSIVYESLYVKNQPNGENIHEWNTTSHVIQICRGIPRGCPITHRMEKNPPCEGGKGDVPTEREYTRTGKHPLKYIINQTSDIINHTSKKMEREKHMQHLRQDLQYMKENLLPEHIYGLDIEQTSRVLCPLLGYQSSGEKKTDIKVGLGHLPEDIGIHIFAGDGTGYKYLQPKDLNEKQLAGLHGLLHQYVTNHYIATQRTLSNPQLKDILPDLEEWAKKCVAEAGKEYTARMDFGKRVYDTEKYHAIVVERKGTQIGTIPLRQDKFGELTHNVQIPLCGEWDRDRELNMDDCLTLIRKGIESIVGEHIVVSSLAERVALEKKVVEQKTAQLEQLMDLKVQVQKYNSWMPMSALNSDKFEHWNLEFEHGFNNDDEPLVKLNAWRGKGAERIDMDLGRAKLDLNNPNDRIILNVQDDNSPELTAALLQSGKAQLTAEYTRRHQDYPGAEEIEEFHFKRIDVTDLYRQYIQLRNAQHLFSPVTDIRAEYKGDGYDLTTRNWICIKLGGLSDLEDKCNRQESLTLKLFKDKPLYNFLLQDIAQQKFAPEINHLKDAMQRITDVNDYVVPNGYVKGPHIRCKIDGEQQMSLSVGHDLLEQCRIAPDPELAKTQLAALFYQRELAESRDQAKGMKR